MRGKVTWAFAQCGITRITPAYAGKSCRRIHLSNQPKDHPRLCGEKAVVFSDAYDNLGSPPPMRGKAFNFCHTVKKIGITPAYAGKSYLGRGVLRVRRDHPRLCGEKFIRITPIKDTPGSPPPMRGKECYTNGSCAVHRITPAYAGKSVLIQSFFIKT